MDNDKELKTIPPDARKRRAKIAIDQLPISVAALNKQTKGKTLDEYYHDLLSQSKLISQLLAYSWLSDDEAAALTSQHTFPEGLKLDQPPSKIAETLQYKTSDEIKAMIQDQTGVNLDDSLGPNSKVCVNWNIFDAFVVEKSNTAVAPKDSFYTFNLPYPPRPQSVEGWQLEIWILDTQEENCAPPYPYIPLSGGT